MPQPSQADHSQHAAGGNRLFKLSRVFDHLVAGAYAQEVETQPIINGAVPNKLPSQSRTATGVVLKHGQLKNKRLRIKAGIVVAAAGALHTPALLLRSDITGNGLVGSNLRLHPAHCVTGIFPAQVGAARLCARLLTSCNTDSTGCPAVWAVLAPPPVLHAASSALLGCVQYLHP